MIRKIKLFEGGYHNYRDSDSSTMARYQIFEADTKMLFEFDKLFVFKENEILDLISKYNETYNLSKEWGGGPVNKEFIDYFNKSDLSFLPKKEGGYGNSRGLGGHNPWKPNISLLIYTLDYGNLSIGYSLLNKRCISMNWKNISRENSSNYDEEVSDDIYFYVHRHIYMPQLTIDKTIDLLRLNVENKIDWEWDKR